MVRVEPKTINKYGDFKYLAEMKREIKSAEQTTMA